MSTFQIHQPLRRPLVPGGRHKLRSPNPPQRRPRARGLGQRWGAFSPGHVGQAAPQPRLAVATSPAQRRVGDLLLWPQAGRGRGAGCDPPGSAARWEGLSLQACHPVRGGHRPSCVPSSPRGAWAGPRGRHPVLLDLPQTGCHPPSGRAPPQPPLNPVSRVLRASASHPDPKLESPQGPRQVWGHLCPGGGVTAESPPSWGKPAGSLL